jgi:GT2 family glycosyltransferase
MSNTGFALGNNIAINATDKSSEWVVLLNPDAFPEPRWLEELLLSAQRNPQISFFGSKLIDSASPQRLDGTGDVYHMSGLVWRTGHGSADSIQNQKECEIFSPCAAAAMYRRSVLLDVGGFDEDFFCYVEDVDLGFRLRLAGHRCLYVPNSVVHHVGSGTTGGQNSDFSVYHGHRNLVWTYVKNMPGLLFWLLLPIHLLLNLVSVVWFSLSGRAPLIWQAKRDALLGLRKAFHKRQQIQKSRKVSISAIWEMLNKQLIPKNRKS